MAVRRCCACWDSICYVQLSTDQQLVWLSEFVHSELSVEERARFSRSEYFIHTSGGCETSGQTNLTEMLTLHQFIMSDWSAQHAGVSSALAGLDQTMPGDQFFDSGNSYFGANLTIAVLNGTVPQWRLDDMAIRIMAGYYYVDREANQVPNAPNFSSW